MRCTAAASPAAHTRAPSGRSAAVTAATSASPGGAPSGRSSHCTVAPGWPGSSSRASGWATSTKTRTGLSAGRTSRSWPMAGIADSSPPRRNAGGVGVDRVTPSGPRERHFFAFPGRRGPRPTPAAFVDDDLEIESVALGVEPERRQGPDRRTAPVGQQELVAVPGRHDELVGAGGGEQQPHTGRGLLDDEALQLGTGHSDTDQPGGHRYDRLHRDAPERGRFPPALPSGQYRPRRPASNGDGQEAEDERCEHGDDHRSVGHRRDDVHSLEGSQPRAPVPEKS